MEGGFCTSPAGNFAHFQSFDHLVIMLHTVTLTDSVMLDSTEAIIIVAYNANAASADSVMRFSSC